MRSAFSFEIPPDLEISVHVSHLKFLTLCMISVLTRDPLMICTILIMAWRRRIATRTCFGISTKPCAVPARWRRGRPIVASPTMLALVLPRLQGGCLLLGRRLVHPSSLVSAWRSVPSSTGNAVAEARPPSSSVRPQRTATCCLCPPRSAIVGTSGKNEKIGRVRTEDFVSTSHSSRFCN